MELSDVVVVVVFADKLLDLLFIIKKIFFK